MSKYYAWMATACMLTLLPFYQLTEKGIATDLSNDLSAYKSSIISSVVQSEYYFKWNQENESWSATNRNQGLRFIYTKDGFKAEPRVAEDNSWQIRFSLPGHSMDNGSWDIKNNTANYSIENATLQYINTPEGMRQNFILNDHLLLNGENDLEIGVHSNLSYATDKTGVHFSDALGTRLFDYTDLRVWDADHKAISAYFKHSAKGFKIHVDAANARFPLTIDPIGTGTNGSIDWETSGPNQAGAEFGVSVAGAGDVNGDGYNDVIAGAYLYDDGFTDEGAAFLYYGSDTGLSDQPNLIISDANQTFALFGINVDGAGDVNGDGYSDVIVGAYYYDDGASKNEGAAFIYHGSASGLIPVPAAIADDIDQQEAQFGRTVSGAGDVNGDGFSDVIIGSWNYNDGIYSQEGRALVYYGSVSGISNQPDVVLSDCDQEGAFFGIVSAAGDVNADGFSDVVVTAHNYDSDDQLNTGRGFVYFGSAAGLSNTANVILDDAPRKNTFLGISVSEAGDINGDGYSDLVIGSPAFPGASENEGIVLVYHGNATGLEDEPAIRMTGRDSLDRFGSSVAAAGDVNGDGYGDVIISSTPIPGAKTYIHYGSITGIKKQAEVTLDDIAQALVFGDEVAGIGDINGDGLSDVMIAALGYDELPRTNIGRIYAYYGSPADLSSNPTQTVNGNQSESGFASGLQTAGDVNGDGFTDLIIGAASYDQSFQNEGAAFLYYGTSGGLASTPNWTAFGSQQEGAFGRSVTYAGDLNGDGYADVAISATQFDNENGTNAGRIYIYHGSAAGLSNNADQILEGTQPASSFGFGMASAGDVNGDGFGDFVAGAWGNDNGVLQNTGKIALYYGSDTGVAAVPDFVYEPTTADASMGESVTSGDFNGDGYSDIAAGASFYTNSENKEGAVFIFNGSLSGINTANIRIIESNQQEAAFGVSVSTAGDVNADAFSDLIIGSRSYDGSIENQGAAFLYTGSSAGLSASAEAVLLGSQQLSFFGNSVSSAGDVNADGYSDIMVGAYWQDGGLENEGKAWIYLGSPGGLLTIPAWTAEGNQSLAQFGQVVACAGDLNGDGFSDVVAGAPNYSNSQLKTGQAFLYYGGNVAGRNNSLRIYNLNTTTPVRQDNINVPSFTTGLNAFGIAGRENIKMVWEARAESEPFSKNLASFTGSSQNWVDAGINGTELLSTIEKTGFQTKLRARVAYQKTTALNGQVYGPWRYSALFQQGILNMGTVPLPVNLLSFNAALTGNRQVKISWITENATEISQYIVQHSINGFQFMDIGTVTGNYTANKNRYEFIHNNAPNGNNFYRLALKNTQGSITYSSVKSIRMEYNDCVIFPNPAKAGKPLNIISDIETERIVLQSETGVPIAVFHKQDLTNGMQIIIPAQLKAGVYFLTIQSINGVVLNKKIFIEK